MALMGIGATTAGCTGSEVGAGGGDAAAGGGASGGAGPGAGGGGGAAGRGGSSGAGTDAGGPGGGGGGASGAGGGGGRTLSTDRADFFGASRCAGAGLLLCEDFEASAIDARRWQKGGNGTATVDATRAARGARSLHVHADGNGFAYLRNTSLFPVAGNTLYARMLVWFDAMPTAPQWAHWTIAEGAGTGDGSVVREGGQYDGKTDRFGVGSDDGPTGDWTNLDEDPPNAVRAVPTGEWVCLEWMWNGGTNETRLWWDGVEHPSLATTSRAHGGSDVLFQLPQMTSVWVGWWLYQAAPTPDHYDVWIDEVAFDGARIGCDL